MSMRNRYKANHKECFALYNARRLEFPSSALIVRISDAIFLDSSMSTTLPVLSLLETRVLGVLAEKQRTVPDTYPLTLN